MSLFSDFVIASHFVEFSWYLLRFQIQKIWIDISIFFSWISFPEDFSISSIYSGFRLSFIVYRRRNFEWVCSFFLILSSDLCILGIDLVLISVSIWCLIVIETSVLFLKLLTCFSWISAYGYRLQYIKGYSFCWIDVFVAFKPQRFN